jgi:tRNA pseudouridine38-40 synthase
MTAPIFAAGRCSPPRPAFKEHWPHALAQVAVFSTDSPMPVENWARALNHILPGAIRVLEASEAEPSFHPRKSAKSKTYFYRIHRAEICAPFLARYVWHYPYPLDEEAMGRAAGFVIGEHDFTSFAAVDPERASKEGAVSNVRTILESGWHRQDDELIYTVRGSGFLHHMVRNLVGTFIVVGKQTFQPEEISEILRARNRSAAGATAPANGLYLKRVEY